MATAQDQAEQRIKAVEAALDAAEGEWNGVGVTLAAWAGITPKTQVLGALATMRRGYEAWAGRGHAWTPKTQAEWGAWIQEGNDLLHNIETTAQDASDTTLQAIVIDTTAATVVEASAKAAETAKSALNFSGPILLGLALVGGLVLAFKAGVVKV